MHPRGSEYPIFVGFLGPKTIVIMAVKGSEPSSIGYLDPLGSAVSCPSLEQFPKEWQLWWLLVGVPSQKTID